MKNQITVENLTHTYGSRCALDNVSFTVSRGEIFCILGPNGSGKTTLFKIFTTLIPVTAGNVNISGYNVNTQPKEIRKRLGVVFQHPGLDVKLTVVENLRYHGHLYGLTGKSLKLRISEQLERFGISDRAHDLVEELSGGLQRRVEIAKAMLHSPQVLLLDEPSSGLDVSVRKRLFDYLSELAETDDILVLLTTHLLDEAEGCNQVGILDAGKLVALGTPNTLKSEIGGDVVLIETHNKSKLSRAIADMFNVSPLETEQYIHVECENGHELVRNVVVAFPDDIQTVQLRKPTLEDVFLKYTGNTFE